MVWPVAQHVICRAACQSSFGHVGYPRAYPFDTSARSSSTSASKNPLATISAFTASRPVAAASSDSLISPASSRSCSDLGWLWGWAGWGSACDRAEILRTFDKTVPFGGTFSVSTLLYISFGTKPRLPRDVFGWDNCTRENRDVRQAVQIPEGERHGRPLSRCRRYRLKRPSRDGGGDRVYVRARSHQPRRSFPCEMPSTSIQTTTTRSVRK